MLLIPLVLVLAQVDPARAVVTLGGDYWQGTDVGPGEVWGVADLHAHYFNWLAFGGRVLHGAPWAPNGMPQALRSCRSNHGQDASGRSTAVLPEPAHGTAGYPSFTGWPRYDTLIHQQAYVDWIRRAWQGGLRLVQVDVQNTPFLGTAYVMANGLAVKGDRSPVARDDVSALELQVGAARFFFSDQGPASDFAAIAYTPAQARRIIATGRMAVVLGIEVESLGNFSNEGQLGAQVEPAIHALATTLWEAGIRHVIPIHLTRNAFGHPAFFNPTLNVMNFADTGEFYATGEAFDAGVRFDPRQTKAAGPTGPVELWGRLQGKPPFPSARALAATEGLTHAGALLIEELMARGFLIDIEHMSQRGADQTLALAVKRGLPVMSSHADFRDLSFGTTLTYQDGGYEAHVNPLPFGAQGAAEHYGTSDALKVRTERSRTREQLRIIRDLGGVVGLQLVSHGVGVSWRDRVPLDCDGSSKGFLQMLGYASEQLGEAGRVAIASDVGGFATMPAPRFGPEACPGARGDAVRGGEERVRAQALLQRDGVRYQTPVAMSGLALESASQPPLERSVAGTRQFDVNVDGVAHYGMIPDFLQDSANVSRAAGAGNMVAPLFRSAEVYLQMWERIEAGARSP